MVLDKDQLDAVPKDPDNLKTPNPNAFPLVMIHGWDAKAVFMDADHTDPNEGLMVDGQIDPDKADRFTYVIKDLVELTNGVYRPMFVTHSSRSGMMSIGNALANQLRPSDIYGIPSPTGGSGNFSYLDTFSFSMGGLIARCYQAYTGAVHNMVLAGTPNHGTFSFTEYLRGLPRLGLDTIGFQSPGTADLLAYDDRSHIFLSTNPRLQRLNQNPGSTSHGEMTLIAGTDKGITGHLFFLPSTENDGVVPVDSVFCRTSDPNDGSASLLEQPSLKIYESTYGFTHFNFGGDKFRIGGNQALEEEIANGLSDWVVTKLVNYQIDLFSSDPKYIEFVEYKVSVQYNVYKRTMDKLALVIYAKDENGQWHVSGNYADSQGNITYSDPIEGNSEAIFPPKELSTNALFQETDKITDLAFEVVRLKPGQETVSLEPGTDGFGLPGQ
jgi:pimeloyl-ACP methyl ester carboxylesterase